MLVMNPRGFCFKGTIWTGVVLPSIEMPVCQSSLWHQKWLLSHLSAKQGLKYYFSYVWFLSNFSNSMFQLLWVSLSILTYHFEE